jgi:hypothetical protein
MNVTDMDIGPMKEYLEEGRLEVSLHRLDVRISRILKIIGFQKRPYFWP